MHPIERLRYVARSSGAPQDVLVEETAVALAAFADDPVALVTACRRIVSRQVGSGALWWLCSRMLCAADPRAVARDAVREVAGDPTAARLAGALPDGGIVVVVGWSPLVVEAVGRRGDLEVRVIDADGCAASVVRHLDARGVDAFEVHPAGTGPAVADADVVLIEALAAAPGGAALAPLGSRAAAAVASAAGVEVWLAAGVGRVLPDPVWRALAERFAEAVGDEPWEAADELVPLDVVDRVAGPDGVAGIDEMSPSDCPIAPELFRADIT